MKFRDREHARTPSPPKAPNLSKHKLPPIKADSVDLTVLSAKPETLSLYQAFRRYIPSIAAKESSLVRY